MRRVAGVVLVAAFAACSILEPRPDPTRFFVLSATATNGAPAASDETQRRPRIGLGPVMLPGYLARPELVRRTAANELEPSRFERWGEPLESATLRVLAEDLTGLSHASVARYPWLVSDSADVQVVVDVHRFEPVEGARVELVADLEFRDFGKNESFARHHEITVPIAKDDGAAVAAAMSAALLELARRVDAR
jgi:uncharacterized lipoprotein YmbA